MHVSINHSAALAFLGCLPDGFAELCLTDIPYGEVNRPTGGLRKFDKGDADNVEDLNLSDLCVELCRVVRGSIYVFCGIEQVSPIRASFVKLGMSTRLGIWEKANPSPANGQHLWLSGIECCVFARKKGAVFNEHCKNSVWRFPRGRSKSHPTEKPLALFKYLVSTSSAKGSIVIDPFLGSGTTAQACLELERRFIGCDINPAYVEQARKRCGL